MYKKLFLLACVLGFQLSFTYGQSQGAEGKKTPAKTTVNKSSSSALLKKAVTDGQDVYMQYCVSCHQIDGGGVSNMNPPLIKTSYVSGDKKVLISILLNGMSDKDIDGESYQNVMPPFDYLTDKEIADVLTYVRNSFGNKASMIKEEEVKIARASNNGAKN